MWILALCSKGLNVRWVQCVWFLDFPAPTKNKVEVHAKMLWVSIENFSSWIQNPDRVFGSAFAPLYLWCSVFYGGEKFILVEGNVTLPLLVYSLSPSLYPLSFLSHFSLTPALFFFFTFTVVEGGKCTSEFVRFKAKLHGEKCPLLKSNGAYITSSEHLLGSLHSTFRVWLKLRRAQMALHYYVLFSYL